MRFWKYEPLIVYSCDGEGRDIYRYILHAMCRVYIHGCDVDESRRQKTESSVYTPGRRGWGVCWRMVFSPRYASSIPTEYAFLFCSIADSRLSLVFAFLSHILVSSLSPSLLQILPALCYLPSRSLGCICPGCFLFRVYIQAFTSMCTHLHS